MTGPIQLHVLVTGVQTDPLALAATGLDLAAIALYLTGVRRLVGRGRRWPVSTTAAFVCGVAFIWLAVGSGLAAYDDDHATIHVVQHALLMMVAPPLIALGRPVTLALQAAHRPAQIRALKVLHSNLVSGLTYPTGTWLLYYGAMYACFLDRRLYDFLLEHPLAHDAGHVGLLIIGYLYWQPLMGGDPTRWRLSHRARMTSTLSGTVVECVLGVAIMTFRQPLSPLDTLADTHMAGTFFLILAPVTCGLCVRVMPRDRRWRPAHVSALN